MDDPSQRRRQHGPPVHLTLNPSYSLQAPSPYSSATTSAARRYGPVPLVTSPSATRSMDFVGNCSSHYEGPQVAFSTPNMSATAMAYGTDSQAQNQSFGSHKSGMTIYNVAHPSTQNPVYDMRTDIQMMTSDVASAYFRSEVGTAAAPGLQHSTYGSGASSGVYQQNAALAYGGNMPNVSIMHQQPLARVDAAVPEDHDPYDAAIKEKWANYQRQLGTMFQDVQSGSLEHAAETLLSLSNWLLTQVADLGLSQDDVSLHDERIKLWNDFNHAWLALGFQQKTMMESIQRLGKSQRLMSKDTVKKMGDEIIRLCNGIERYGLVDYQYGVWEERIVSILEECLDLYEASWGFGTRS